MFLSYNDYFSITSLILVLLAVLFAITGFKKGFMKRIVGFVRLALSVVAVYFLKNIVSELLLKTPYANKMRVLVFDKITKLSFYNPNISTEDLFNNLHLPKVLKNMIPVGDTVEDTAQNIASSFTEFIIVAISIGLLFVGFMILLTIVCRLFDGVREIPLLGIVDGILGFIYSMIQYVVIVAAAITIITLLMRLEGVNDLISYDFNLGNDGFRISKWLYEHNPLLKLLN